VKFYDVKGRGSSEREPSIIWQGYYEIRPRIQLLNIGQSTCIRFINKANYREYTKCRRLGSDHDGKIFFYDVAEACYIGTKETSDSAL
jgi:nitrogen regulatory protein PII